VMEKLTASLLAAASVALLYLLLRRRASPRLALLLTLAFAFGTTTWAISSQALWQHGLGELLLVGALLLVTGPCTASRAFAAGVICGLIAGNRPPDAILAAALGLYGLWWAGRLAPLLAAGAAIPLGIVLTYNLAAAGKLTGGYGLMGDPGFFHHPLLPGIAGLLLSPARGLFIFTPFLLFLPFGFRHVLRDRGAVALALLLGIAAVLQVLLYAKTDWRAGYSWGPRFLTDLLPLLLWMLPPVVAALRSTGRIAFVLAVGAAIAIEAVGAFWYTGASDVAMATSGRDPVRAAWDLWNTPFIVELQHPRAPGELFAGVRGTLDSVQAGGRDVDQVIAGTPVLVQGWALIDDQTPGRVDVLLAGQVVGVTETFRDRSDVRATFHQASPAGWGIVIPTGGVGPGEHLLAAAAQVNENGDFHIFAHRHFTVLAAPRRAP
jgi:hypothetical protein